MTAEILKLEENEISGQHKEKETMKRNNVVTIEKKKSRYYQRKILNYISICQEI